MRFSMTAAVAGLGLLAAACSQTPAEPAKPEEAKPAAADPAFDQALTFNCEGGGKLDVVFNMDQGGMLARFDGGPGQPFKPVEMEERDSSDVRFTADGATIDYGMGETMTYESGSTKKTCTFVTTDLPAPTVAGVKHVLTSADAGKTFDVKIGEKVSIALVGVPTAGYLWAATKPPAWVKASDGPGGATSSAQLLPGFAGGSHWEVVIIEAVAAGEGEITLAQRRPWEDTAEPDASTFVFKLKAS